MILVINKTDMVKPEEILKAIDTYRQAFAFAEIVPVSARNGDNTDELVKVIMKYLPYGPQFYDEDTVTDQPERQIVAELIRREGAALSAGGNTAWDCCGDRPDENAEEDHAH